MLSLLQLTNIERQEAMNTNPDLIDLFHESAARYEFDGGRRRDNAEYLAMMEVSNVCGNRQAALQIMRENRL